MFRFPFTNFHELNLDWILSVVKEAKAVFDSGREDIDHAVETADEAKALAQEAVESVVPDNSVTTPKIRDYAVTSDKIATFAVTTDKIQEGGVTTSKLAPLAVTTAKLQDGAVTASKIAEGLLYSSNLLDNWYFVRGSGSVGAYGSFPVNQKGQASYTNAGYTIDRLDKASSKGTVYTTAQGLQFSTSDDTYAFFKFFGQDAPPWMTVTYTVLTNLGITSIKQGDTPVTLPSGILVYIDATTRSLALRLPGNLNQSDSETFIAAKVEIGESQTLAHKVGNTWILNDIPNYGELLAKCQKYLFDSGNNLQRLKPSFVSSDTIDFFIPLPVSAAHSPTTDSINTLLNNSILIKNSSATTQSGFTCSISGITANGLSLRFTKTNHGLNSDCFMEISAHTLFNLE